MPDEPTGATIAITLRLFAQLRVSAGAATIERRVAAGSTAGDVARAVLTELGLAEMAGRIVLSVNADYSRPGDVLQEGDWLSLVPPVSGGGPVVDVQVGEAPLDVNAALAAVADPAAGGTVVFQGTPREVDALDFEAHDELARTELARIGADLVARHGLVAIALHHRLGRVPATEAAIVVVAAAPRRGAAFEAAREALDEVKRRVPIWKAEVVGGSSELVEGQVVQGVPTLASPGSVRAGDAEGGGSPPRLTHLAADGSARMVDVTDKAVTDRLARAVATVRVSPETARLVADGSGPKGEVLATARLAGVLAAKRTAELVPLAHPLPLTKIDVQAQVDVSAGLVRLEGHARTTGKTGVEIEALTAVLIAALTVYDMVKAVERRAVIEGVQVTEKAGGRHDFTADAPPSAPHGAVPAGGGEARHHPEPRALRVGAVHVSTTRTKGVRPDRSRAALDEFCARTGWAVVHDAMVTDDRLEVAAAIRAAAAVPGVELVLTLGGTGLTSDDVTPEATLDVVEREIPGLGEALRAVSREVTPLGALSRATAGSVGAVLIVNLPGSPKALGELESLLTAVLPHAVSQVRRGHAAASGA
ncbi:MAG: cyclic pyranopterin monophosphate synthase MoaC [Patulibacter minatonensis]